MTNNDPLTVSDEDLDALNALRDEVTKRDELPALDAVYLFGQTQENQRSVLSRARDIQARVIAFDGHPGPIAGYPGAEAWKIALRDLGVPESKLLVVESARTNINTSTESEDFIKRAKKEGWKKVGVVASPFHQLRVYMTAVTWALKTYPELVVYSVPGEELDWNERVSHSQGELFLPRAELVFEELVRVLRYWKRGDLASPRTVLEYMRSHTRK